MGSSSCDLCTACQRVLPSDKFSRKMRTKPAEKRRCTACVEESGAADEAGGDENSAAKGTSKLSELQALCASSADQAEKVTGLKPVRGGSAAGRGKGRGRGGYR